MEGATDHRQVGIVTSGLRQLNDLEEQREQE